MRSVTSVGIVVIPGLLSVKNSKHLTGHSVRIAVFGIQRRERREAASWKADQETEHTSTGRGREADDLLCVPSLITVGHMVPFEVEHVAST